MAFLVSIRILEQRSSFVGLPGGVSKAYDLIAVKDIGGVFACLSGVGVSAKETSMRFFSPSGKTSKFGDVSHTRLWCGDARTIS